MAVAVTMARVRCTSHFRLGSQENIFVSGSLAKLWGSSHSRSGGQPVRSRTSEPLSRANLQKTSLCSGSEAVQSQFAVIFTQKQKKRACGKLVSSNRACQIQGWPFSLKTTLAAVRFQWRVTFHHEVKLQHLIHDLSCHYIYQLRWVIGSFLRPRETYETSWELQVQHYTIKAVSEELGVLL